MWLSQIHLNKGKFLQNKTNQSKIEKKKKKKNAWICQLYVTLTCLQYLQIWFCLWQWPVCCSTSKWTVQPQEQHQEFWQLQQAVVQMLLKLNLLKLDNKNSVQYQRNLYVIFIFFFSQIKFLSIPFLLSDNLTHKKILECPQFRHQELSWDKVLLSNRSRINRWPNSEKRKHKKTRQQQSRLMTVLKDYAQERQELDGTKEEDSRLLRKYQNKAVSDR